MVKARISTKIIMGDSGALVIGLIISIMVIKLWGLEADEYCTISSNDFHVMAFTMILVPCIYVVRVVLYRVQKKQPLFLPYKNHFHHKLIALGFTHHQSLVIIIAVSALLIILNTILANNISILYIIIDLAMWTIMHVFITKKII